MANKPKWKKGTRADLAKDVAALLKKPGVVMKKSVEKHVGKEFEYCLPMGIHECSEDGAAFEKARAIATVYVRPAKKTVKKAKGKK